MNLQKPVIVTGICYHSKQNKFFKTNYKMMRYLMSTAFIMLFTALQAQDVMLPKKVRKQFAGTWSLVTVENTNADGSKTLPYGENPVGLLVFTDAGDYAIQILKVIRPKVAAGDKNKATPGENAAL